ncbi:MAG: AtpZ/AtpI family protein [Deltaproteobacteria bacterium]|nr:AtpZ/AtpI family protein [Deltaproteobacteria bacterium]
MLRGCAHHEFCNGAILIDDSKKQMWLQASRFSYLGLFFGVAVVIGFAFGTWLDRKFHTHPWFSMLGVLFGIASGFKELFRMASSFRTEQKKKT